MGEKRSPIAREFWNFLKFAKFLKFHEILEISVSFTNFEEFPHFCENGLWRAPTPPPTAKFRALRGGFPKSWVSQGRILYPKPWSLQGGFLEKWIGIKGARGRVIVPSPRPRFPPLPDSLLPSPLTPLDTYSVPPTVSQAPPGGT